MYRGWIMKTYHLIIMILLIYPIAGCIENTQDENNISFNVNGYVVGTSTTDRLITFVFDNNIRYYDMLNGKTGVIENSSNEGIVCSKDNKIAWISTDNTSTTSINQSEYEKWFVTVYDIDFHNRINFSFWSLTLDDIYLTDTSVIVDTNNLTQYNFTGSIHKIIDHTLWSFYNNSVLYVSESNYIFEYNNGIYYNHSIQYNVSFTYDQLPWIELLFSHCDKYISLPTISGDVTNVNIVDYSNNIIYSFQEKGLGFDGTIFKFTESRQG